VINLPHRQDRKLECIREFESVKFYDYEFIEAVNWKLFKTEILDEMSSRDYKYKTKNKRSIYGNVACGLSHLKVLDKMVEDYGKTGDKAFMIFEDDFSVERPVEFMEKVNEIINATNDWSIIYLGGLRNPKGDKREPFLPGIDKAISVWNAHAYIVKNDVNFIAAMKELASRGYYADRAIRKIIRDDKHNSHRYLVTWPYQALQRKSYSDIDNIYK